MRTKKYAYVLAGLITLATGSASATMLDFTPGNLGVAGSTPYNAVNLTNGDISVDVTAFTIENNGTGTITNLTQITGPGVGVYVSNGNNLGVESHPSSNVDTHNLDGGNGSANDPDEGLLFTFNQTVALNYINFDSFSGNDDFNLTVDGVLILVDFRASSSSLLASRVPGQSDEFDFFNISGTEFLFWADGSNDSFRIDRFDVSAVPAPATALLMGLGLVGFSLARRKSAA